MWFYTYSCTVFNFNMTVTQHFKCAFETSIYTPQLRVLTGTSHFKFKNGGQFIKWRRGDTSED